MNLNSTLISDIINLINGLGLNTTNVLYSSLDRLLENLGFTDFRSGSILCFDRNVTTETINRVNSALNQILSRLNLLSGTGVDLSNINDVINEIVDVTVPIGRR